MRYGSLLLVAMVFIFLTACQHKEQANDESNSSNEEGLTPVSFMLEWTPNTNHTGIYVAQEKGYFEEAGLEVDIMLPGEAGTEQLIASEKADFGMSVQEHLTIARDEGMPLVSIAAIMQHNTAGYTSDKDLDINNPKDFEGKTFGAVGNDLEQAIMQTIMKENDADFSKVDFKNIGDADFFAAIKKDIDFSLVYEGWTGKEAELRNQDLNMVYLKDFSEALDFYTPVLATSESMVEDQPEQVEAFVHAAVKGYEFAIEHPEEAAEILSEKEPDLNPDLVQRSQAWVSEKYRDDSAQFGVQEEDRWKKVEAFMLDYDIIEEPIQKDQAFTNEFLPTKKE